MKKRRYRRMRAAGAPILWGASALGLALSALPGAALAYDVETEYVGLLAGLKQNGQPRSSLIAGTDLGFTTSWSNGFYQLVFFGDTYWGTQPGQTLEGSDDAVGYFFTQQGNVDTVPPLTFSHWADVGAASGGARTPIGAAQFGGQDPWYGLFLQGNDFVECSSNADCDGLVCDKSMGTQPHPLAASGIEALQEEPCWLWSGRELNPFDQCEHIDNNPNRGLCRDGTSSMAGYSGGSSHYGWDPVDGAYRREEGKIQTVAMRLRFGPYASAGASQPTTPASMSGVYDTVPFATNKFINATMRTTRGYSNYGPATDPSDPSEMLWIWGRPSFWKKDQARAGTSVTNADNQVYLAVTYKAYAEASIAGNTPLQLFYRTASGWSTDQEDAAPLPTQGGDWADGPQGQMSVTWVPEIGKWVMLYGGGGVAIWEDLFGRELARDLRGGDPVGNVDGTIKMRMADDPWGPWSEPKDVLDRDDASICGKTFGGAPFSCHTLEQGPWGPPTFGQWGALYGPSIVEPWTQYDSGRDEVSIGWFVSTFNPYKVHQMKTVIEGPF